MASDSDARALAAQLRAVEHGEAAPWMLQRPQVWWNAPLFGVLSALLVLVVGLLHGIAYSVGLTSVIIASWILTYLTNLLRGPRPAGTMPPEFRRALLYYLLAGVAVVAAVAAVAETFGVWPAAGAAFILAWTVAAGNTRLEARAATLLRDRLR